MRNIVDIIGRGGDRTLVLLDELGAGTDPTEGAALGIAILEKLRAKGAYSLATTHYTELKKYAIATEGVENASMEFDVETLSPTYRLRTGLPGRSNAFEISKKLGLPEDIINRAAGLLDTSDIRFETVIRSIEADRKAAEEELDEATMLKLQMRKQKEALDEESRKLSERMDRMLADAREEAREMITEAKEYADLLMRELRELPELYDSKDRNRRLEENRKLIRELNGKYRTKSQWVFNPEPLDPAVFKVGDMVKVLDLDQSGELITLPDDRGDVQVQLGRMKINTKAANLVKLSGKGKSKQGSGRSSYSSLYSSKVESILPSISVRGENLESALAAVDKYLDDAFMAGLREVTIIHGRGEGILRDGVHRMMKGHRHVKSFRRGGFNEGGDGVTVVSLKDR
jgi:DNA mismatch repair protein MutS2